MSMLRHLQARAVPQAGGVSMAMPHWDHVASATRALPIAHLVLRGMQANPNVAPMELVHYFSQLHGVSPEDTLGALNLLGSGVNR